MLGGLPLTEHEALVLIQGGETLGTEFKRDAPLSDSELVEVVVCLANSGGGHLFLGVENDGTISGLHSTHRSATGAQLEALVANRTVPGLRVGAQLIELQERWVAVISVDSMDYIVQTSDGRAFRRVLVGQGEPECRPMQIAEIASRLSFLGRYDYSEQRIDAAEWSDLDPLELERIRQEIAKNARGDKSLVDLGDEDLAAALGLAVHSQGRMVPTVAGILGAGKEATIRRFVPTHELGIQVFQGDGSLALNEFFRLPVVRLFRHIEDILRVRNSEIELMVGIQRVGVPRLPMDAVREAIANALTHRDYTIQQSVHVQLGADYSLRTISPGGFVEGVSLDNILSTGPRPRNRALADLFKRIGVVDRAGRGVERMFESVLGAGRVAPDYSDTRMHAVDVLLPGGEVDLSFVRLVVESSNRDQRAFDWRQLLVLRKALSEGEITRAAVSKAIQGTEHVAVRLLEGLVDLGLLEQRGAARSRVYLPSAAVYRRLGRKSAYVRRRGFEESQQRQMVLSYIDAHGRIKRAEVRDLCQVTEKQAEYLLKRMRADEDIDFGEGSPRRGRNVFYSRKYPNEGE